MTLKQYSRVNLKRSRLNNKLNFNGSTELCQTMKKFGSDKGLGHHNYTILYTNFFSKFRNKSIKLFEMGIGTCDCNIPANMGSNGKPGASLFAWREYFKKGKIYSADIDKRILFKAKRIRTFYCDQLKSLDIKELWDNIGGKCDIIIDDGLHTFEANTCLLESSIIHLKRGGLYIIEDIARNTLGLWEKKIKTEYQFIYDDCIFSILEIPNSDNDYDNNLIVIEKEEKKARERKKWEILYFLKMFLNLLKTTQSRKNLDDLIESSSA